MSRAIPPPVRASGLTTIDDFIEVQREQRQGNKVLHGYPPPLLWREREVPVADVMALRRDGPHAADTAIERWERFGDYIPSGPIHTSILNRLRDMLSVDRFDPGQIRQRTRDFQNAVVRTRR